jgi:DNA-binding NtrC family response regulator
MSLKLDILIVDDEPRMLLVLKDMLSSMPHRLHSAADLVQARNMFQQISPELVICDLRLGEDSGLSFLKEIQNTKVSSEFIMLTAHGDVATAVEAIKLGAYDFLLKPTSEERLLHTVNLAAQKIEAQLSREVLQEDLKSRIFGAEFIGKSLGVEKLKNEIVSAAKSPRPVLIQGESGTGKELVARAIHKSGDRSEKPLVVINCATLSKDLAESELFGHERGAFTGAEARRRGKFELADKGTLFLDEIGELPLALQPKLLRVLEDGSFERVGGEFQLKADVRIIAATNRDLKEEVDAGRFRLDLFHRINTFMILVPPLCERGQDIILLSKYFAEKFAGETGHKLCRFSTEASQALLSYAWPGNVRELRNVIERACAMVIGDVIEPSHLGIQGEESLIVESTGTPGGVLAAKLEANERDLIITALKNNQWVQARAARELGLNRSHLHYKIKKLGIKLQESK